MILWIFIIKIKNPDPSLFGVVKKEKAAPCCNQTQMGHFSPYSKDSNSCIFFPLGTKQNKNHKTEFNKNKSKRYHLEALKPLLKKESSIDMAKLL